MPAVDWIVGAVEGHADPQGDAPVGHADGDSERDGAAGVSEVRPVLRPEPVPARIAEHAGQLDVPPGPFAEEAGVIGRPGQPVRGRVPLMRKMEAVYVGPQHDGNAARAYPVSPLEVVDSPAAETLVEEQLLGDHQGAG
jgi:hypothetical protein